MKFNPKKFSVKCFLAFSQWSDSPRIPNKQMKEWLTIYEKELTNTTKLL